MPFAGKRAEMPFSDSAVQALSLEGPPKRTLVHGIALLKPCMLPSESENLRMGGGTALAMRWKHRVSTDIDLILDKPVHRAFLSRASGDLTAALQALQQRGEIRGWRLSPRFAGWEFADSGPISLSASSMQRACDGREAETGVALAATESILTGKLMGRVLGAGALLVRDGYDLCCAFRYDREAALAVLDRAKAEFPDDLDALCARIGDAGKRIIAGRPLMSAAHPVLAHDPWGAFVEIFKGLETEPDMEAWDGAAPD